MRLFKLVLPFSACVLMTSALGCMFVATSPPSTTLTVRWLIEGTVDPGLCALHGATTLELVVYDARGSQVVTANAPCEAFSLTLPLAQGIYSADATLVDPGAHARSVTLPLHALDVVFGTDLAVDIAFPRDSFLELRSANVSISPSPSHD